MWVILVTNKNVLVLSFTTDFINIAACSYYLAYYICTGLSNVVKLWILLEIDSIEETGQFSLLETL